MDQCHAVRRQRAISNNVRVDIEMRPPKEKEGAHFQNGRSRRGSGAGHYEATPGHTIYEQQGNRVFGRSHPKSCGSSSRSAMLSTEHFSDCETW